MIGFDNVESRWHQIVYITGEGYVGRCGKHFKPHSVSLFGKHDCNQCTLQTRLRRRGQEVFAAIAAGEWWRQNMSAA